MTVMKDFVVPYQCRSSLPLSQCRPLQGAALSDSSAEEQGDEEEEGLENQKEQVYVLGGCFYSLIMK